MKGHSLPGKMVVDQGRVCIERGSSKIWIVMCGRIDVCFSILLLLYRMHMGVTLSTISVAILS